jgi:hypothetical protein
MAAGGEEWPTVKAVHTVSLFHEYCALSNLNSNGLNTFSQNTPNLGAFLNCLAP